MAWDSATRAAPAGPRIDLYLRTILREVLLLGFVLAGVRLYGGPLAVVWGARWRSMAQLRRDLAIGLCFWAVALAVTSTLGSFGRHGGDNSAVAFLIPHGYTEGALWILVSLSAGICEEAVYRGYLQRQCIALTKHVAPGILLPALAFGSVHLYQGWERAAVICCGGILSGVLTHWRGSVRPAMIAHALQDGSAPLLLKLVSHG